MKLSLPMGFVLAVFYPSCINASESMYKELDTSIINRDYFIKKKESRLLELKTDLGAANSLDLKYQYSKELVLEYSHYINDSALYYVDNCLSLAEQLNNEEYVLDNRIDQAYLLCFPGLFNESIKILEAINPESLSQEQRRHYYTALFYTYHNLTRSVSASFYVNKYKEKIGMIIDDFFRNEEQNTKEYLNLSAYKYYLAQNYHEAINVLKQLLKRDDLLSYQRVETQFNIGDLYTLLGEKYKAEAEDALIRASILANEYVVRKNPPLIYLAIFLFEHDKHLSRAYNYINIASEDATLYIPDYKSGIIKKIRNDIESIFYDKIKGQQYKLRVLVIVLFVFCLLIALILVKLFQKNKVLLTTRQELGNINAELRESNRIKGIYVTHYLNRYSDYLDKVETFKKHILRQVNASASIETIKREMTQSIKTDESLSGFFSDFDKSVLDLYPDFVEKVNKLLKDDRKFAIGNQYKDIKLVKLNTELRILALLRLGITENKQIASFFRFTVQTVYNYRSRLKARAINEDTFEEDVKKI